MNQTWRHARRRMKHAVAGAIFVGLLIGASGTVFTAFSAVITHLGTTVAPVAVTTMNPTQSNTTPVTTPPTSLQGNGSQTQTPVMEYTNVPSVQSGTAVATGGNAPDPSDGSNSALAAAMDTGGVYVGERVQRVFGSMLKGVLNTLFINSN